MLVVTRYVVPESEGDQFMSQARPALEAVIGCRGCVDARLGRAIDDPTVWVFQTIWESIGSYRRALSSPEVKTRLAPLMHRAVDEPSVYEPLLTTTADGVVQQHASRHAPA